MAAHPGYTATGLQQTGPAMGGATVGSRAMTVLDKVVGSRLRTARGRCDGRDAAGLPGGSFVGPAGPFEQWGPPGWSA